MSPIKEVSQASIGGEGVLGLKVSFSLTLAERLRYMALKVNLSGLK